MMNVSSVQAGTVCPSIRVRWSLKGVVLHCRQGSEQVSFLWPVWEHLISNHLVIEHRKELFDLDISKKFQPL